MGGVNEITLDEIVREWARAQIQRMDIVNYNGSQMSYNHQADMANRLGLSEQQKLGVTPYPCPTNQTLSVNGQSAPEEERPTQPKDEPNEDQTNNQPSTTSANGSDSEEPASTGKSRSILWPTISAAALSALMTAGSIGGTAWMMRDKPRDETVQTEQINSDGRVGVDVIGWPQNSNRTFQP